MNKSDDSWLLQSGEKILDWTVLQPLGRGGMGEVYLVERSSQPSYTYALKLFTAPHGTPEFFKKRFLALGEGLLQLAHPALAKLLYVGVFKRDGMEYPFSVMTFIGMSEPVYNRLLSLASPAAPSPHPRAYSLADILARPEGLSLDWLDRWYRDVAAGLQHLHEAGFAHGDIKPTNILIDATGRAVLIDFGLATALSAESQPPGYEKTHVVFQSSRVFRGTPAFTAPELLAGGSPTKESDWYSLGATFFFARTGVTYYPSAEMRLFLDSIEAPWGNRFQRLLNPVPSLRDPNQPDTAPCSVAPRTGLKWAVALLALLLLTLGGATFLLLRDGSADGPAHPVLTVTPGAPLAIHLQEGETRTLALDGTTASLANCTVPATATLIVQGPGHLQLNRNEQALFLGTLHVVDKATVAFTNHHENTRPKIVTTAGTRITAPVGNNRRSQQQFSSLDMSRGGTFTGDGIRFFINHQEPNEIRLGDGAVLTLPWIATRGVIHATGGESEIAGTNVHFWYSLWVYADAGATLTLSGTRFFMYDYWRGDDFVVDTRNRGTVIFDYDVMRPLCKFHFKGGTTVMRCDMVQSFDENWCQLKTARDWVVYPKAAFCGATALTFHEGCSLLVKSKGCLIAGENGFGEMAINHLTLENGAVLQAPGAARFTCGTLHVQDKIILDLAGATATAPLSWENLVGNPDRIQCINIPRGMRVAYTSAGIQLRPEGGHEH